MGGRRRSWLGMLAGIVLPAGTAAADLEVGANAPHFELLGADGERHALADHVGKRGVVLAFFPKAFTPG